MKKSGVYPLFENCHIFPAKIIGDTLGKTNIASEISSFVDVFPILEKVDFHCHASLPEGTFSTPFLVSIPKDFRGLV